MKGTKNDTGKLRYDLIPPFGHQELARVFTIGAKKYSDNNWRGGFKYSRVIAAAIRHLEAWRRGEQYDPQDGQLHLSSVAWAAYVLMEFEEFKIGEDDRIKYGQKVALARKKVSRLSDSITTPKSRKRRKRGSKRRRLS